MVKLIKKIKSKHFFFNLNPASSIKDQIIKSTKQKKVYSKWSNNLKSKMVKLIKKTNEKITVF